MTTVAHSSLTGSDLHEPKGVASASVNTLYVANGAGSGAWTQVPLAALAASINGFGNALIDAAEVQSTSVSSTMIGTAFNWTTCKLNTALTNDQPSQFTLNTGSNSITLPAGTYYAIGAGTVGLNSSGQITAAPFNYRFRLYDISHSTILVESPSYTTNIAPPMIVSGIGNNYTSNGAPTPTTTGTGALIGRFTLANQSTIVFQANASATFSGGQAGGLGSGEIYDRVCIWKVA